MSIIRGKRYISHVKTVKKLATPKQPEPKSETIQPKIYNLSKFPLSRQHIKLLSHGAKFTPNTKIDYFDAKHCNEIFTRKLKILNKFADTPFTDESLCRNKSTYPISCSDEELSKIIRTIEEIEPSRTNLPDNLTHQERKALHELRTNDSIIMKEADKGGGLVIMDKTFYHDKLIMKDHLSKEDVYRAINPDEDTKAFEKLKYLVKTHENCLTKNEIKYITDFEWESSYFYVRPKVHKCKSILDYIKISNEEIIRIQNPEDLTGRPIVAGTNSPTRHLSDVIGMILKPLVPTQKTYVKDDWDYLGNLPHKIDYDSKLFGCDISSLYTSIPHELGLKAIKYWLEKKRDLIPNRFTNKFIIESIEFLLLNNNFIFNNQMYKQLEGTAMGSTFASFYACLVVGYLEETILFPKLDTMFTQVQVTQIKENYKRYMDDGIIFLPVDIEDQLFLDLLNDLHPKIKFTLEKSYTEEHYGVKVQCLNFLDIKIILHDDRKISTDISYKSTNSHDYLHFDSFHPKHTIENIPYNLAKRILVFVTDENVMKTRLKELRAWLTKCKYPQRIIDKAFHNAFLQGPANKPTDEKKVIPFVTTHSSNFDFSGIMNTARELLKSIKSPSLKNKFEGINIVHAERQPKNILRMLMSTKFSTADSFFSPGLFAECKDRRCKLCHEGYIQQCTSFTTSNGKIWEIRSHINCNTKNVLYFLVCNICNGATTYTGKTKTRFRIRINNHISDVRTGNTTDKFDIHVHNCCIKHNNFQPPFFKVYAFMALTSEDKLITYEKYLHRQGFDTMNN